MVPVDSSNIASIGHENGTLYISFHSGGVYSYAGVPGEVYRAFLAADSHGKFFHQNIKDVYQYTKLS